MDRPKKPKILAVVGSTASGKTALSIALAKRLDGEIVSCDSMQIYRRMDVGTAKPTLEEREAIPHHLIDCVEPDQTFSSAEYVLRAGEAIDDILARGRLPILCGGTGLYLDCLLRGGGFEKTVTDERLRTELFAYASQHGNAALHRMLAEIDPEAAASIHENNVKRVVRAIEIYRTSGMTKSEADRRSIPSDPPYDATVLGLRYNDRALLYRRIGLRVDAMMAAGLKEETERLLHEGIFEQNSTAAQAIGYKELLGYLRGECLLEEALETLRCATRRYAKRQITWFSAKPYVRWIDADHEGKPRSADALLEDALAMLAEETP